MAKKMARTARQNKGYRIYSFHPYVLRPELSVARVHHRVENGGHDVPIDTILYRYDKSLKALPSLLHEVDIGIVMDNSGRKPYMPIFAKCDGYITDFVQCPEYLQPAHQEMIEQYPQKSIQELINWQSPIEIFKMNEEQRENFGQIIITKLLGQI